MNPTATDWASSDATQNITLADADRFKNQLVGALAVDFADRFVKTVNGETVHETELRHNPFPAGPVNLWGTLSGVGAATINVAQLRASIRTAARSNNPAGELLEILHHALPKSDVSTIIFRVPAVAAAIGTAISGIA